MKKNKKIDSSKKSNKFMNFTNKKLMPIFSKLSTQRELVTIRDAFGIITPLIIAGAISLIGAIFFFGGSGGAKTSILGWIAKAAGGISVAKTAYGETWEFSGAWLTISKVGSNIFSTVTDATIGLFSIYVAFEIAYVYTKAYKKRTDAVIAGFIGLAGYGIVSHGFGGGHSMFMGASGILVAIIVSFLSAWLFDKIGSIEKLKIKMPKEVPPAVSTGFSYIIPVLLTLLSIGLLDGLAFLIAYEAEINVTKDVYDKTTNLKSTEIILEHGSYGFAGLFYKGIAEPFQSFTSSSSGGLGIAIIYSFFVAFFWWFGINGSSVMNGIFSPILTSLVVLNAQHVQQIGYDAADSQGLLSTVSITFLENYTQLTGWGMTGGLIVGTFIFSKIKQRRQIAKLASVPALFNVNEPMTFGYPIMLNPIYAIPSILVMPLNTILAFIVVDSLGWVNKTYLFVPWTVPPGVGALLATGFDWKAIILAWFCLAVAIAVYIPFILFDNLVYKNKVNSDMANSKESNNKKIELEKTKITK